LNWFEADEACKARGAMLPEINSFNENLVILKQKVCTNLTFEQAMV
jgi:hypothetical protein